MNKEAATDLLNPESTEQPETKNGISRIYALPLIGFAFIAVAFAIGLTLNPRDIPSVLIGEKVPEFNLPAVQGRTLGLSDTDLKGEVSLVNVFASWCTACRAEHPLLMNLAKQNIVPVHGLNYKDKPDDAQQWLDSLGDPYTRTGADIDGRVAIDWGVYGVPETFIVDKEGRIAYKQIGAITQKILDEKILPFIRKLQDRSDQ